MKMMFQDHIKPDTFLHQYIHGDPKVMEFYDYPLNETGVVKRYEELKSRKFERTALVKALLSFNRPLTNSEATFTQIHRLLDEDSVVVVGGQQAGLLTGPVYTINKILSILHEAKMVEEQLEVPVIPIFWIAGEDHDVDEVNHTYFHYLGKTKKILLHEKNSIKQPVSERKISIEEAKALLKDAFLFLPETMYTKGLYSDLIADLNKNEVTYVQWFARIIHRLFKDTGLVLMDAADPNIRNIEKPYFQDLLKNNDNIRAAFSEGAMQFRNEGFGEPIEINENNAHIFIHDQGQRFLLEKEGSYFKEKNGINKWTLEALHDLLNSNSSLLSNNVVTRPIMQDKLLPVVSFVSGPGELMYWGTLKKVFRTMGICMPLIYPRLHLAFVSRSSEKNLQWMNVEPHTVTTEGIENHKTRWFNRSSEVDVPKEFQILSQDLENILIKVENSLKPLGPDANQIHDRYKKLLKNELNQYEKRVGKYLYDKHRPFLLRFDKVQTELRPNGNWQERYLNIFPFLNEHGEDLILQVLKSLPPRNLIGSFLYVYL
ncbi:bacillithiol biosynthesis cysteine-adding enzyme BshC [Evansella sp. AB-rgal1]|uniref:bacillithiol biosynthesis cysteine-adding enzyme BshC n=1 Tax=Evansella sp. AB-rgal1 TaxID=3242696 RepID=UPI00359E8DCF